MPRRTNVFQEVVAVLHAHLASDEDVTVEESAMLRNVVTGEEREVDVVLRSTVAAQEMVLAVEATMQKGSSPWVEQMIGKHADLPTDRLVLVAEKGFSKPAKRYAARKRVAIIEPQDMTDDDPTSKVVNQLQRMWPKGIALTPDKVTLLVEKPDGTRLRIVDVPLDALFFRGDSRQIGTAQDAFHSVIEKDFRIFAEQIGLADITEDRDEFFIVHLGDPARPLAFQEGGPPMPVYVQWQESPEPELHQVLVVEYRGRAGINVAEVALTHRRFDQSSVAYGEGQLGDRRALFVVSEDSDRGQMTIRFRPEDHARSDLASDVAAEEAYEGKRGSPQAEE